MTILFPDVSSYTPNVDPAQYPALLARATLSDRVADPTYAGFKAKADAAGTVFAAYHWLNHGNIQAQARWAFQHVGPSVPLMIDAEDEAGNTGYAGPLTVDDITSFAAAYRKVGGIVSLAYLPFWYWSGAMGAPHRLGELTAAGLGLVASNYPRAGYTENGPGWAAYGGATPVQWQYTDTPIDMNAFRGTAAEYARLIGVPQVAAETIEVQTMFLAIDKPTGKVYLCNGLTSRWLPNEQALADVRTLVKEGLLLLENNGAIREGWNEAAFGALMPAPAGLTDAQVDAAVAKALTTDSLAAALRQLGISVHVGS